MSYIGQTLPADSFQGFTTDSFTGDGSATTFTLSKTPFNESALLVVINNVVQKPTTNFTVSGTTLTIVGTAVASSDVIYATHIGGALPIGQAASLDLNGASDQLILDADADTTISADTDDQIDFKAGGTDIFQLTATTATINDGTTITTNDNSDTLTLVSTDADANVGPNLNLYRNSSSPADDDVLGLVIYNGQNDNNETIIYARQVSYIKDASDGTEDGQLTFQTMVGGTTRDRLNITPTETVFNEESQNLDFRVEGSSNASTFFIDASADRIGIGTQSPDNELDIKKAGNAVMKIESTNNGDDAKLLVKKAGSSSRNIVVFQSDNSWHVGHLRNSVGTFAIATQDDHGSSNEMQISTSGVTIAGALSKGSGSFKIQHPHPDKKDTHNLVHSFIEGPQADLIYRGKVDLVGGSATVNVDTVSGMTDGTFVLLNTNVQCFTSNETGWTAVKGSVSGNTLTITAEDNSCTDTISWMVVGERHDQHMKDTNWTDDDGKVIVEPLKEVEEDA
jgi:hypothetical protein